LASILPAYSDNWPKGLKSKFPTEKDYHNWFIRFIGIFGDPVAGRKLIRYAKERGIKLHSNPYGYPRAFTNNPEQSDLELMQRLLEVTWGNGNISVLDPMAGGGSIPFEALRYGFTTYANELNPVASVILKATLDYPARFGEKLFEEIRKYGKNMSGIIEERLAPYFPRQKGESIFAYIWARTVACPATGKPVPLSPNWWLQKGSKPVAVKLLAEPKWKSCRFEIVQGEKAIKSNPDDGTISRGTAISPWTGDTIDGDYIKAEAQVGRMGQQLYALGVKTVNGKSFRAPNEKDLKAVYLAENELKNRLTIWEAKNFIPTEEIPIGNKTSEPRRYGMYRWMDVFSSRQLLSLGTYLEVFHDVMQEARKELSKKMANALETYLAFAIDKGCDRNSYMARWITQRQIIANTFDRHDFGFKWSYAEFDACHNLFDWTLQQIKDSFKGISELLQTTQLNLFKNTDGNPLQKLTVVQGNAQNLSDLKTGSIHLICVDPPYYDNVMYSECSDFFYVWMKRTLGNVYPQFFTDELTNKDNEAVANVARFEGVGRGNKRDLAEKDYERKMAACFREMKRVLHPDGVLTVMFTHKKVEAWDTLALALIGSGFAIEASWPVHTEFDHSLHQAKKNAAASTIFLVCRKRTESGEEVWWDDIKGKVREIAREKAAQFHEAGISGVDLYLSTFGPVLSVISESWPVLTSEVDEKTGEPKPLRPETALSIAREEVIALRKQGLLLGQSVQFDPVTDWVLMAWDAFKAEQFPADEARKLALALGMDIEEDLVKQKRIITKKQNFVSLLLPQTRRRKGAVDPEATSFSSLIDALHTAMLVYDEDGAKACEVFLKRAGLMNDTKFKAGLQALVNAVPRTKEKDKFKRPEAATLEALCLAFFDDISLPVEEEPVQLPEQLEMQFKAR
jgi:adenine-specific DNA methylase